MGSLDLGSLSLGSLDLGSLDLGSLADLDPGILASLLFLLFNLL